LLEKTRLLYGHMKRYYSANDVHNRLDRLIPSMIWDPKRKKAPKLRTKAAEARALISFGRLIAEQVLDKGNALEHTMIEASKRLEMCYSHLSEQTYNAEGLKKASVEFCSLYAARTAQADNQKDWRFKPKFHLMQELCERTDDTTVPPSQHWTYRDEDFGGSLARMGHKRGGPGSPAAQAKSILLKFAARHQLPTIV